MSLSKMMRRMVLKFGDMMKKIIVGILIICILLFSGCTTVITDKSKGTIVDVWVEDKDTFFEEEKVAIEFGIVASRGFLHPNRITVASGVFLID